MVPSPTPTPENIKIGFLFCLSGAFADEGQRNKAIVEWIINKINAEGGVYVKELGKKIPIKPIIYDIESSPIRATELAIKMISEEKPLFLLMSSALHLVIPIIKIVEDRGGTIFFQCDCAPIENYMPILIERGGAKWTWIEGSARGYAAMGYRELLAKYKNYTNGIVGVVCIDDPEGRIWNETMTNILAELGYKIVNPGLHPIELTDFTSYVMKFKEENVDVVWVLTDSPKFADFWRKATMMGFKPKLVVGGRYIIYERASAEMIGGNLALGLIAECQWHPNWRFAGADIAQQAWSAVGLDYT